MDYIGFVWFKKLIWLVAATFVQFTAPNGHDLDVNADEISSIREPANAEGRWPKGVRCVLFMNNGRFNAVMESCKEVKVKLRGSGPCVLVCGKNER